jgi:hypothetical protein
MLVTAVKLFLLSACIAVAAISWSALRLAASDVFRPDSVADLIAAISMALFFAFLLSSSAYFGCEIAYQLIGAFVGLTACWE